MIERNMKNTMKTGTNMVTIKRRHVGAQETDYNHEDKRDDTEMLAGVDHVKEGSRLSIEGK